MTHAAPLEQRNVRDKEELAVFRFFRCQWIEMLDGADDHAISKQITALLSADLEFRTIVRSRELNRHASNPQNGMIHWFIDEGFFAHQVLTIRRMTEEYDGQKRRAVYSLPRIMSEIEERRELITREMYVCVDGDPYDATEDNLHTRARHAVFDKLAQVDSTNRSRDDLIHADYVHNLRTRLESSKVVRTYANKFLAHAAAPSTRTGSWEFSVNDLEQVYKDLVGLTRELSERVLYHAGIIFLPSYIYDVLAHFDNPVCHASKLRELEEFWEKRQEELRELEQASVS